jgi:hypothetical protein
MALIFSYMKLLDPGSTVREGEYASVEQAAGVPEKVRHLYNKALEGRILGEGQRKDFLSQSSRLFQAQMAIYNRLAGTYASLAHRYGVAPGDVVLPLGLNNGDTERNKARDLLRASGLDPDAEIGGGP